MTGVSHFDKICPVPTRQDCNNEQFQVRGPPAFNGSSHGSARAMDCKEGHTTPRRSAYGDFERSWNIEIFVIQKDLLALLDERLDKAVYPCRELQGKTNLEKRDNSFKGLNHIS